MEVKIDIGADSEIAKMAQSEVVEHRIESLYVQTFWILSNLLASIVHQNDYSIIIVDIVGEDLEGFKTQVFPVSFYVTLIARIGYFMSKCNEIDFKITYNGQIILESEEPVSSTYSGGFTVHCDPPSARFWQHKISPSMLMIPPAPIPLPPNPLFGGSISTPPTPPPPLP